MPLVNNSLHACLFLSRAENARSLEHLHKYVLMLTGALAGPGPAVEGHIRGPQKKFILGARYAGTRLGERVRGAQGGGCGVGFHFRSPLWSAAYINVNLSEDMG